MCGDNGFLSRSKRENQVQTRERKVKNQILKDVVKWLWSATSKGRDGCIL